MVIVQNIDFGLRGDSGRGFRNVVFQEGPRMIMDAGRNPGESTWDIWHLSLDYAIAVYFSE